MEMKVAFEGLLKTNDLYATFGGALCAKDLRECIGLNRSVLAPSLSTTVLVKEPRKCKCDRRIARDPSAKTGPQDDRV